MDVSLAAVRVADDFLDSGVIVRAEARARGATGPSIIQQIMGTVATPTAVASVSDAANPSFLNSFISINLPFEFGPCRCRTSGCENVLTIGQNALHARA